MSGIIGSAAICGNPRMGFRTKGGVGFSRNQGWGKGRAKLTSGLRTKGWAVRERRWEMVISDW